MRNIILLFSILLLIACSSKETNENNPYKNEVESTMSVLAVDDNSQDNNGNGSEELEKFWEVYSEDEIVEVVQKRKVTFDFEKEAPMFEEALIESLSKDEDRDWTPYLGTFNFNIGDQAPEEYIMEMFYAHRSLNKGEKEKAIEHILKAKEIRESQ